MQREPFGSVTRVTLSAATEIRTHSSPSQPFWLRWMTLLCESKQNITQTRQFSSSFFGQNTAKKEKILPSFGRNHIGSWRFREVFVFVCIFLSLLFFARDRVQNGEKQPHFSLDNIVDVHCGTCTKHSVLAVVSG